MEKAKQIEKLNFANSIMQRIISKGGIMGSAAKMYIDNAENTDKFIKECSEQCHNKTAKDLWGEQLVLDILNYSMNKMKKGQLNVWRSKSMSFIPIES